MCIGEERSCFYIEENEREKERLFEVGGLGYGSGGNLVQPCGFVGVVVAPTVALKLYSN